MAKVMASRFAVLRIDDDDDVKAAQRARDRARAAAEKLSGKAEHEGKARKQAEKNAAKARKAAQERSELQALAFGGGKRKKPPPPKKKPIVAQKGPKASSNEWKRKDEVLVEGLFEHDLQEALLASKVEYEKNRETSTTVAKETEDTGPNRKAGNRNKGHTTVSLDVFNQSPQAQPSRELKPSMNGKLGVQEEHFFNEVVQEASRAVSREKHHITMTKKAQAKVKEELAEGPRVAQLQEDLRLSNEEVSALRLENEKLREELANVKKRNQKLCGILMQGEMKEKAVILVEMEKLAKVKDELAEEVERLSKELEQERSKCSALADGKKNVAHKK